MKFLSERHCAAPVNTQNNTTFLKRALITLCALMVLTSCSIVPMKSAGNKPADEPPVYATPGGDGLSASGEVSEAQSPANAPRIDLFDYDEGQSIASTHSRAQQGRYDDLRHAPLMEPGDRLPGGDMMLSGMAFNDLWERVRSGFAMDLTLNNRRINQHRKWYIKHNDYLLKVLERARPYLYQIVVELEAQQVPLEMALLPVIESAYDPFAYSRSGAAGLWQFIPSTGASLALKQNWWYDGRRDITASTRAAATYLKRLNEMFDGDWELTLAAYNGGSGTVRRARALNASKGKPTDFWSLKLSDETENYVPKLMAIAQIVQNPTAYGLNPLPIANAPHFTVVETQGQIDLARASQMSGVTLEEVYRLNPGFNRWASDPEGPHQLALPVSKAILFEQTQMNLNGGPQVNWERYTVKQGDTLISLAEHCNSTVSQIKQANHLRANSIRTGQQLILPIAAKSMNDYAMSADNRLQSLQSQPRKPNQEKTTYTVRAGDTLWSIASKYGISVSELAKSNGTSHRDALSVGQTLVIWQDKDTVKPQMSSPEIEDALSSLAMATTLPNTGEKPQGAVRKVQYKVRSGDSLYRIADKFNVTVAQISQWNDIEKDSVIHPGQELVLYLDATEISQNP